MYVERQRLWIANDRYQTLTPSDIRGISQERIRQRTTSNEKSVKEKFKGIMA